MSSIYNSAKVGFLNGGIDFDTDTIRVALVSNSTAYTPDIDNESYVSDVLDGGTTASEFSGSGYARQTLSGKSVTQDNTDDEAVADGSDITFSSIDGDTIQGVLVYQQVGGDDATPADDQLIAYITSADFPLTANGGDVTISWAAEGILNLN
jgi:hypothetical protein